MKKPTTLFVLAVIVSASTFPCVAQQPEMPAPVKEHEWLQQLTGEWESESEAYFAPDQPPFKCKGVETARLVGGFWLMNESKSKMMDFEMTGIMTLGFDPEKKKYVGTWVDSATSYMWKYEGTVDDSGKILTLDTEGPNMLDPTKMAKYKEVIEIKGPDHKTFNSSVQTDNGEWYTFMKSTSHRKKK